MFYRGLTRILTIASRKEISGNPQDHGQYQYRKEITREYLPRTGIVLDISQYQHGRNQKEYTRPSRDRHLLQKDEGPDHQKRRLERQCDTEQRPIEFIDRRHGQKKSGDSRVNDDRSGDTSHGIGDIGTDARRDRNDHRYEALRLRNDLLIDPSDKEHAVQQSGDQIGRLGFPVIHEREDIENEKQKCEECREESMRGVRRASKTDDVRGRIKTVDDDRCGRQLAPPGQTGHPEYSEAKHGKIREETDKISRARIRQKRRDSTQKQCEEYQGPSPLDDTHIREEGGRQEHESESQDRRKKIVLELPDRKRKVNDTGTESEKDASLITGLSDTVRTETENPYPEYDTEHHSSDR